MEFHADLVFDVEHLREFSHSHAMPDRQREVAGKGFCVLIHHRALNPRACERIRPVQNIERDPFLCRGFHRVAKRGDVGVVARPRILDIEDQSIKAIQHLLRRL
jgi:hypothetical protein